MIFEKLFANITYQQFISLKIANDSSNTTYTINNGIITFGKPDILWDYIVFITDKQMIWTHGVLFGNFEQLLNRITELESQTTYLTNVTNLLVKKTGTTPEEISNAVNGI